MARNYKVPRIIVRMRDPRYEAAYKVAGVTRALDIGKMFVNQLLQEIELPSVHEVATFGQGKASIAVVVLPEGSVVDGKTVREVAQDHRFPEECIIAGIFRETGEQFIIPRGAVKLRAGDQLFLAADSANVRKAAQYLQATA